MSQQPTLEERLRAGSPQKHRQQGTPELSKSHLCPTPALRPFLSDLATYPLSPGRWKSPHSHCCHLVTCLSWESSDGAAEINSRTNLSPDWSA